MVGAWWREHMSATRVASFGVLCRQCPLRQRCTTSKTGRKIVLHERDRELRAARAEWAADPELREKYGSPDTSVGRLLM